MSVPPPDRTSVPLWTLTVPLLLKVVEIVEVSALPLLVKVPGWVMTAVTPVSVPPKLLAKMLNPLLVVWSLKVAPLPIVKIPEPGLLLPFNWMKTNVPAAVLVPPSCSVRPPSSVKPVELNAAPPCAIVVPDPLCVPPDNVDRPVTVNVPDPLRRPPDWVSAATEAFDVLRPNVPALMFSALPRLDSVPERVAVPPLTVVVPDTL